MEKEKAEKIIRIYNLTRVIIIFVLVALIIAGMLRA